MRTKIFFAFQTGQNEPIVHRKRIFSFACTDSPAKVHREVSGLKSGRALWPRAFGERVAAGWDVSMYGRFPDQDSDDGWFCLRPQTRLHELFARRGLDSSVGLQVLFRVEDPQQGLDDCQARSLKAVSSSKAEEDGEIPPQAFVEKHTFLHVISEVEGVQRKSEESSTRLDCVAELSTADESCSLSTHASSPDEHLSCSNKSQLNIDQTLPCEIFATSSLGRHLAGVPLPVVNADAQETPMSSRFHAPIVHTKSAFPGNNAQTEVAVSEMVQGCKDRRDVEATNQFFHAILKGRETEVRHLVLNCGVDVLATDVKGSSAMHFWARSTMNLADAIAMGEFLTQAGGDVNARRATDGMTPLHHVIICQNNHRGSTAFYKAVFLLKKNADVNSLTVRNQTARDILRVDHRAVSLRLSACLELAAAGKLSELVYS